MKENNLLVFLFLLLLINASLIMSFLTFENYIYGVDSWYWAKFLSLSVLLVNLIALGFYFTIGFSFLKSKNFQTGLILSIIFLSSFFSIRFFEFELDDFFIFSWLILLTFIFPKKALYIGLAFIFGYILLNGFIPFDYLKESLFLEQQINFLKIVSLAPVLYILLLNKKYIYSGLILILFLMFPFPKFVSTALPFIIFPILYSLRHQKLNYSKFMLILFVLFFVYGSWTASIFFVDNNNEKFIELCDQDTKICDNSEVNDWWVGHYFAYIGYEPTNYPSSVPLLP